MRWTRAYMYVRMYIYIYIYQLIRYSSDLSISNSNHMGWTRAPAARVGRAQQRSTRSLIVRPPRISNVGSAPTCHCARLASSDRAAGSGARYVLLRTYIDTLRYTHACWLLPTGLRVWGRDMYLCMFFICMHVCVYLCIRIHIHITYIHTGRMRALREHRTRLLPHWVRAHDTERRRVSIGGGAPGTLRAVRGAGTPVVVVSLLLLYQVSFLLY